MEKEIRKILDERSRKCEKNNPSYDYFPPVDNPYIAFKGAAFEEKFPTDDAVCEPLTKTSKTMDKSSEYYLYPRNKRQCDVVNGHWNHDHINR